MIHDLTRKLERAIILCLAVMMSFVLILATLELGWTIIKDVITKPILFLEISELLDIFGLFMLVVIGIELLETIIKTNAMNRIDRAEVVLAVAIIAITRKVVILDIKELGNMALLGLGTIILALSIGFFLLRHSHSSQHNQGSES